MTEPVYEISFLTGVKKLEPVKYTMTRNADGSGSLESEFMRLTGDYDEIYSNAKQFGLLSGSNT